MSLYESPENFSKLYGYHRAVTDAGVALAEARRTICNTLQNRLSDAYGSFAIDDHRRGWELWEPVHQAAVALSQAHVTDSGAAEAYQEYCRALETFERERAEDRRNLQAQLTERLKEAHEVADQGSREAYSAYLEAMKLAGNPPEPDYPAKKARKEKDK